MSSGATIIIAGCHTPLFGVCLSYTPHQYSLAEIIYVVCPNRTIPSRRMNRVPWVSRLSRVLVYLWKQATLSSTTDEILIFKVLLLWLIASGNIATLFLRFFLSPFRCCLYKTTTKWIVSGQGIPCGYNNWHNNNNIYILVYRKPNVKKM